MTLRRRSQLKRGGRVKAINAKRRKSEWARAYGSRARVRWIANQACACCHRRDVPSQNAHTESGGASRKADASTIIPLCPSCHRLQHTKGWSALDGMRETFGFKPMRWRALAATLDLLWESRDFAESE